MDELRKSNKIKIKSRDKSIITGVVEEFSFDRVLITVDESSFDEFDKVCELDEFLVTVYTHFGIKKMFSCLISKLNEKKQLVIENNETLQIEQKREHIRVNIDFDFEIEFFNKKYNCKCLNISAGGIMFCFSEDKVDLQIDDEILIKFKSEIFEKDFDVNGIIIKKHESNYVAKYIDISSFIEDRITKFVFKKTSKK